MEQSEVERILDNIIQLEALLDLDVSPRGMDLPFLEMAKVVVIRDAREDPEEPSAA